MPRIFSDLVHFCPLSSAMIRQAIIKSLPDGSAYPAGCIYEVSQGGGCALLFQTDGKAMKLLFIAILHDPPRVCDDTATR